MNLLQIRKKLVELSGLYSLVEDYEGGDYSDNGADFFIQNGQKWMERKLDTPNAPAEYQITLSAGDHSILVSDSRAVKRVRVEEIGYLDKFTMPEVWDKYGDEQAIADADQGEPREYAIGIYRRAGNSNKIRLANKKLFIMPPADKNYTLFVEGLFFSAYLDDDEDVNWWSLYEPAVLIQSALYQRETFLRNTQGMNDWRGAILDHLQGIDFDQVEEESADIDQMEDAWNFRNRQPTIYRGRTRR